MLFGLVIVFLEGVSILSSKKKAPLLPPPIHTTIATQMSMLLTNLLQFKAVLFLTQHDSLVAITTNLNHNYMYNPYKTKLTPVETAISQKHAHDPNSHLQTTQTQIAL